MTHLPVNGHDGPYPAPIRIPNRRVEPAWIDQNGHMNVGYYGIAFDLAADVLFDEYLGVGWEYIERAGQGSFVLQTQAHFLNELRAGEGFSVAFRLIDHDSKRMHFLGEMLRDSDGCLCATQETVSVNVDHGTRRSTPFPDWAQRRLAQMKSDHAGLERPPQQGAPIGLHRARQR